MSNGRFYDHGIINKQHRYLYAVEMTLKIVVAVLVSTMLHSGIKGLVSLVRRVRVHIKQFCYQTTRHSLWLVVVC